MECLYCQKEITVKANYCPYCGKEMAETKEVIPDWVVKARGEIKRIKQTESVYGWGGAATILVGLVLLSVFAKWLILIPFVLLGLALWAISWRYGEQRHKLENQLKEGKT